MFISRAEFEKLKADCDLRYRLHKLDTEIEVHRNVLFLIKKLTALEQYLNIEEVTEPAKPEIKSYKKRVNKL